jgi:hypothetical protein
MRMSNRFIYIICSDYRYGLLCVTMALLTLTTSSNAQIQTVFVNQTKLDSNALLNSVRFGFDKIANTFLFRADADVLQSIGGGTFTANQNYRGSTVRSASAAFRDDQSLLMNYTHPLNIISQSDSSTTIELLARSIWQLSRDSRSIGLSSLNRYNTIVGLRYNYPSLFKIDALTGFESNTQLGRHDIGSVTMYNANATTIIQSGNSINPQDGYLLNLTSAGEISKLGDRINSDINAGIRLNRDFDDNNRLVLSAQYRSLNRDFYSLITSNGITQTGLETRLEQRYLIDAGLQFQVANGLNADITSSVSTTTINRSYKGAFSGVNTTFIDRNLDELQIQVQGQITHITPHTINTLSISIFRRDEVNLANKKFDGIAAENLDTLKSLERVRDNISDRNRVALQSMFALSSRDTLLFNGFASILRYDTPSPLNNDDRDEFNSVMTLSFVKQFSHYFTSTLTSQIQQTHLVFLKSQRSALNNWNRIIRLTSSNRWSNRYFTSQPQMEVLAQYTVYDYEGKAGVPQSFSFRQLSYRDSIVLPLTNTFLSETRLYFRYFERAEFFASEFSERTQSRNYEQFARSMILANTLETAENSIQIGIGIRWYTLSQENAFLVNSPQTILQSIAPECSIHWKMSNGTILQVGGWYEFQYQQKVFTRHLPNVSLTVFRPLSF